MDQATPENDSKRELESFFLRFIYVEDASEQLDVASARKRLAGKRWGWVVDDLAGNNHAMRDPAGIEYMGIKDTQEEAQEAAIGYIWACRKDLVKECKKEMLKGRAYRAARRAGSTGMHVV